MSSLDIVLRALVSCRVSGPALLGEFCIVAMLGVEVGDSAACGGRGGKAVLPMTGEVKTESSSFVEYASKSCLPVTYERSAGQYAYAENDTHRLD